MECTVFSRCGRYQIQLVRGEAILQLNVATLSVEGRSTPVGKAGSCYTVQLDGEAIERISAGAGVRKSFDQFGEMIYSALVGRSKALAFFVETCEEMNTRISKECEEGDAQKETSQARCAASGLSLPTAALHISTFHDSSENEGENDRDANSDVSLNMSSELNEVLRNQMFFTIDYDVDFTRAVFPIPLTEVANSTKPTVEAKDVTAEIKEIQPYNETRVLSKATDTSEKAQEDCDDVVKKCGTADQVCRTCVQRERLYSERERELSSVNQRLLVENDRLKRENEALILMSREKMHEMQRICDEFQSRVLDEAAFSKLHRRLEETEVALQTTTRERDHARHQWEALKDEYSRKEKQQQRSTTANNRLANLDGSPRSGGGRSATRNKSASRGVSSTRQGLSLSAHRAASVSSSRSASSAIEELRTRERRGTSRRRSAAAIDQPDRRPSALRSGKGHGRRFDTPPPHRDEEKQFSSVRRADRLSPSPRYPSSERRSHEAARSSSTRRVNRFATPPTSASHVERGSASFHRSHATRGRSPDSSTQHNNRGSARRRTGSASSIRSESSTRSSRSNTSHERLYLLDTVSSRMHKREEPLQMHSQGHVAIFR